MPDRAFQRACAWSGIACVVLFFAAFFIAGFIPPVSPNDSATKVAHFYATHTTRVRIGGAVMLLSSMFYIAYTAAMSGQMRRTACTPTATLLQLGAGAVATVTFMIPSMIFIAASFRPGRDEAVLQALNDLGWIMVVMPWPPFMAQNYAFAYAILSDRSPEPILPRWLGYLNIWAPIIYAPAILLPFFKLGPFDWRGIFVFFVPGVVFTIQFTANSLCLLSAIDKEADAAPRRAPAPASARTFADTTATA